MLNFSPEKLLLVGVIALLVLGPQRLPQAARTFGRAVAELRRLSGALQSEVRDAFAEPRDAISDVVTDLRGGGLRRGVVDLVTGAGPPQAGRAVAAPAGGSAERPPVPDDPSLN